MYQSKHKINQSLQSELDGVNSVVVVDGGVNKTSESEEVIKLHEEIKNLNNMV